MVDEWLRHGNSDRFGPHHHHHHHHHHPLLPFPPARSFVRVVGRVSSFPLGGRGPRVFQIVLKLGEKKIENRDDCYIAFKETNQNIQEVK